jgi:hypothetical protein
MNNEEKEFRITTDKVREYYVENMIEALMGDGEIDDGTHLTKGLTDTFNLWLAEVWADGYDKGVASRNHVVGSMPGGMVGWTRDGYERASHAATEVLNEIAKAGWAEPAIFPTIPGELRMEWLTEHSHTVLTVDNNACFFAFHLDIETGEEACIEPVGTKNAVAFLENFIQMNTKVN